MEVEDFSDSRAKLALGALAISLLTLLPGLALTWVGVWLSGGKWEREREPPAPRELEPALKWCLAIMFVLGGLVGFAVLSDLWSLSWRWIQRRWVGNFLGPLDVRLSRPIGVDEPFSILIKQPVRRAVRIDRLEVSLVCVEESGGKEFSGDGPIWPFIDQRDVYSESLQFGLEDRMVPAGAAPEAIATFALPDATRNQLRERELIKRELFKKRSSEGPIYMEYLDFSWDIRIEVRVARAPVRRAVFRLPSARQGGPL